MQENMLYFSHSQSPNRRNTPFRLISAHETRVRSLLRVYTTTDRLVKLAPICKNPWESPTLTVKQLPPFEKFTYRYKQSPNVRQKLDSLMFRVGTRSCSQASSTQRRHSLLPDRDDLNSRTPIASGVVCTMRNGRPILSMKTDKADFAWPMDFRYNVISTK